MSISEQDAATAPAERATDPAAAPATASVFAPATPSGHPAASADAASAPAAGRTVVRTAGQSGGNLPVPGADCHALAVRLPRADARQGAAARQLAARMAAHPSVAGWSEEVPCGSEEPAAQQRRGRELLRPVAAGQDARVRVVLLRYADGVADLVAVAHRRRFGVAALRACVIELLVGAETAEPAADAAPSAAAHPDPTRLAAELAQCSSAGRPDWGLGDPYGPAAARSCELALSQAHPASDSAGWAAALGLVLARYDGVSAPVLAQLVTDSDADPGAAADPAETEAAGVALVPVPADGARTLGSVHKQMREAAAAGPAWRTEALRREITAAGGDLDDADRVGLVVADRNAATGLPGVRPAEYVPYQAPPFAVTVSVVRDMTRQRPFLRCDFDPRLLSPASAEQLLAHVRRVHEALLREPDTSTDRLELLSAQELDRVHALGRHAEARPVVPTRIDAAIATIAAGAPDAVAVRFEDETLGYGELDRRADRLAHALRELGVADGDRVGVCLERSTELIVSLLAVLKAGATYVPMDPAYPSDRLSYTTTDAGLTTVVTDHRDFPGGESVRVVSPAELAALAPESCEGPPRSTTGPDDAAYVIYTSGSTGRPKGVVIPHRNVLGLMAATTEDFELDSDDVWTLFHSSAFDFSVWEIWGALLTGATLVVVPYWASRSPEEFHQLLLRERVSVLSQTPSAFSQLVEVERDGGEPVPVRLVVFGGEALEPRILLPWFDRHPESRCRVVNMYGITETTVHVTAQTVTRAEALTGDKSVGHALPGWWVRIADPEGRTLPIGVAGEIWVGGTGVATHYLNKPELTEERFRVDPRTGERMYRSGDRGRMLPDGRIEHLGRLDSQVKLRGFRIELDEIRAVLADDPQVSAAVVVLGRSDPDDPATAQLDAYVVPAGDDLDDTAAVRRRAARFLPEYMVPSTVTVLERMPLTTNGKLDTRRLPKPAAAPVPAAPAATAAGDTGASGATPGATAGVAADGGAEPAGETFESVLLEVWQEVLGVPIGPDDNFFDHGGNSLLAMRVGAALRRRGGGFTVAMRELYLRPTIRQLAADRAE